MPYKPTGVHAPNSPGLLVVGGQSGEMLVKKILGLFPKMLRPLFLPVLARKPGDELCRLYLRGTRGQLKPLVCLLFLELGLSTREMALLELVDELGEMAMPFPESEVNKRMRRWQRAARAARGCSP